MSGSTAANTQKEPQAHRSPLVNVGHVAEYIGLSKHTVYTMVSQRRIPFVKVGRLTKFDLPTIDAWIRRHSVKPSQNPLTRT